MIELLFDKLAYTDRLRRAGIGEDQARAHGEAVEEALRESVATKADVLRLEAAIKADIQRLENSTKTEIQRLENNILRLENATKADILRLENSTTSRGCEPT
jgi:hypothetical protein